jgi:hypothetical protein
MKHLMFMIILMFTTILPAQNAKPIKVIPFKELQKILPEKGPEGFIREKPKGQSISSSGISSSSASVEFKIAKMEKQLQMLDDGKQDSVDTEVTWTASVEIVDYAGMGEGMAGALQMISGMDFNNETDEGFERSATFNGYKGIEKSHSQENSRSCSLQLVVGERYIVTASGNGFADLSVLQEILNATDLKKLQALK